jgi:hypothetical protein
VAGTSWVAVVRRMKEEVMGSWEVDVSRAVAEEVAVSKGCGEGRLAGGLRVKDESMLASAEDASWRDIMRVNEWLLYLCYVYRRSQWSQRTEITRRTGTDPCQHSLGRRVVKLDGVPS